MRTAILAAFAVVLTAACSNGNESTGDSDVPGSSYSPNADPNAPSAFPDACAAPRAAVSFRCVDGAPLPRVALGVCGDLAADNTLSIEPRADEGISLAVNGQTRTAAPLHVAGSFTSLGSIEADNTQQVDGVLSTGGDWTTSAPVSVGGDAFIGGSLVASNTVSVTGTLHENAASGSGQVSAGATTMGGVSVASPLDCGHLPSLEAVAGTLPDAATDALAAIADPADWTLGCGTYRFSAIGANNTLSLHIAGATTIVVDGDFHVAAPVRIDLAAGATLDLLVRGSLLVDNTLFIGDGARPDATWLGVEGSVHVGAPLTFAGTLLAPNGTFEADNTVDLTGSAIVGGLHVAAPLVVHDGPSLLPDGCLVGETG